MSTTTILATAVAAGVLGAGAAVTPFATGDDADRDTWHGDGMHMSSDGETWQGPGRHGDSDMDGYMGGGMGPGRGPSAGMHRWADRGEHHRVGDRDCDAVLSGTIAELTRTQARTLAHQAEMEKLSHDVYLALADGGQDSRFTRIAESETRHLDALRILMDRHGVQDPTTGHGVGEFASKDVARQYQDYVDRGSASPEAALAVARQVERRDIAELEAAASNLDASDLERVYEHLADASRMHLEAFDG